MSQIGVSYTPYSGSPVYSFLFKSFTGAELARSYSNSAQFSYSVNGTSITSGPSTRQKYIWAISSIVDLTQAENFDAMFRAWDIDRAAGKPVAIGIIDQMFGSTVNTSAVFTTAPTYTRSGPKYMTVSFGLTEL